ncbi:CARDB domain-containing protein [Chloroflexota bacterium]
MKKSYKLITSTLLLSLLLSTFISPSSVSAADDHPEYPNATTISVPSATSGNIDPEGDRDWFKFSAQSGVTYRAKVNVGSLDEGYVRVYGSDGSGVGSNVEGDFSWTASSTQSYYIEVWGGGTPRTGSYQLELTSSGGGSSGDPDLELQSISVTPTSTLYADETNIQIRVSFENVGDGQASDRFFLKVWLNGSQIFSNAYYDYDPGDDLTQLVWDDTLSGPSNYTITATIDAEDEQSESDEGNNTLNKIISVLESEDTNPPPVPSLYSPDDGASLTDTTPTLSWQNVSDPEGNGDTFDVQVATDSSFSDIIFSVSDTNSASYTVSPALAADRYYWRVRSRDSIPNYSNWCLIREFDIEGLPVNPELCISSASLDFGTSSTSKTFVIENCGGGTLTWNISESISWLSVSLSSGSTTTETDPVTVTVDRSGLQSNDSGTISISSNGGNTDIGISATDIMVTRGYVLYMPGIHVTQYNETFTALDRVNETFPMAIQGHSALAQFKTTWFSYRATGGYDGAHTKYDSRDTRQHLIESAIALDEQIRDLISMWQQQPPNISPEIVIISHSLGGAVVAYWASWATPEVLSKVRTVITLDSPVSGVDKLRGFFGGGAGDDLTTQLGKDRMAYGTSRLDFLQVGNTWDDIVSSEESFTPLSWRKMIITCPDKVAADPGERHTCVLSNERTIDYIDSTLKDTPPLWANLIKRPPAYTIDSDTSSSTTPTVTINTVQDLDNNGTAEDINGDGTSGVDDVKILFETIDSPEVKENFTLFDFNGNGRIDFDDIVKLSQIIKGN